LAGDVGETALGPDLRVRSLKPGFWLQVNTYDGIESNGLIVRFGEEALLVDTPWTDALTQTLLDWAEKNVGHVTTAVVTHSHADRMGGIAVLKARGVRALAIDATLDQARKAGAKELPEAVLTTTQPTYRDPRGFEIHYPGPGHTVDTVVVWFPADRVLHGGCLVKSADAEGMGYVGEADLANWPRAIEELRGRYPEVAILVPGHGTVGGAKALDRTLELLRAHAKAGR
jgi:glyoxylase-like metal-dependent hydrolase (beta-lactamase superfamily II)